MATEEQRPKQQAYQNQNQLTEKVKEKVTCEEKNCAKMQGRKLKKCMHCNYESYTNLRRHMRIHTGEKPQKCNQCNFSSAHENSLSAHLKTHSGEKSHKCQVCTFATSQPSHLRRHLKRMLEKGHTNASNATSHPLRPAA